MSAFTNNTASLLYQKYTQHLRDGVPLLQQPYSQEVLLLVQLQLAAFNPFLTALQQNSKVLTAPQHHGSLCQLLEVLNQYLDWFSRTIPKKQTATDPSAPVGRVKYSYRSDGRCQMHIEYPYSASAQQAASHASPNTGAPGWCLFLPWEDIGIYSCLMVCTNVLEYISAAGQQAGAAVRPQLVAPGTGEVL
jgi:hypothetical protein